MELIWIFLQATIGFNLLSPSVFFLFWYFKAKKKVKSLVVEEALDYAIIVTAYEQTHMISSVLDFIYKLNYSHYHVYIVADKCDISELIISDSRVKLLRPEIVLANNIKSHFYAIDRFVRKHDIVTIIDSDNLVHSEYLNELNVYFRQGFHAVQGVRKPKVLRNEIACLDAARDIYYNFYDSKLLFEMGSSSTLSGSGMAFRVWLYEDCLRDVIIEGAGFDKVLQARILEKDLRIAYAPMAIVYDEKTSASTQLVNQRSRWIYSWFRYMGYGKKLLFKGITGCSTNQILFGIALLRPPLFLFIVASFLCFVISFFINPIHSLLWLSAFVIFISGFFIALKQQYTDKKIYRSLKAIPKFIFYQMLSLYYVKNSTKRSVATRHYT